MKTTQSSIKVRLILSLFCMDSISIVEFEGVPFVEFLTKNDLQSNLRQYIIHCIAMVEETTPTAEVTPF